MTAPVEKRRRLFVDPSLIDVNVPLPDAVLVVRETQHLLRTLPEAEAAKLLGSIILAAAHDGAIPESPEERRKRIAHERVCKVEENGPHHGPLHEDETEARRDRRDRKELGLDPRPTGRPRKTGQTKC
jgi:hypothetical protein